MTSGARGSLLRKQSDCLRVRNQIPLQKQQQAGRTCDVNWTPIDTLVCHLHLNGTLPQIMFTSREVRALKSRENPFQTTLAPVWTSLLREYKTIFH